MAALTLAAVALMAGAVEAAPKAAPGGAPAAPKARDERPPRDRSQAPGAAKDDRTQPVTVDADKMERFGKEGLVVFTGNVVARQNNSVQYAERMEVYLDEAGDKILRTVSTGAVRIITRDCRTGTARRA